MWATHVILSMKTWILALIGIILQSTGDLLIMTSVKTNNIYLFYIALVFITLCGIPLYFLVKSAGWISGTVIWNCVGVFFSLTLAIISGEKQTIIQWIGFIVMLIGIGIRSFKF